jgi:hypothetical protein
MQIALASKSSAKAHSPFQDILGVNKQHSSAPVSTGNTFQDLPRLRETADNTERYYCITRYLCNTRKNGKV